MRLSEWRAKAKVRDALGTKVMAVVSPVLGVFGVEDDPHAWVQWGDDPASKYSLLVPIPAGLVVVAVRASTLGSGPRATAKVVRWSRLQMGELAVETEGPHRMISFQVESFVLRGADDTADAIGRFALVLLAATAGREWPPFDRGGRRAPVRRGVTGKGTVPKRARPNPTSRTTSSAAGRPRPAAASAPRPAAGPNPGLPALPSRTPTRPRTSA